MKKFYAFLGLFLLILILLPFSASFAQDDNKLHGINISGNPDTQHRVFVVFKSPPGSNEQKLVKGFGGSIRYTYRIVPAIAATIPEAAIQGLQNNPNVVSIEAVGQVRAIDTYPWNISHIGSDIAHNPGELDATGKHVKIAIIDSGIDCTHPDLDVDCADGYNFINENAPPFDDLGHGTHVAGIVAADNDGLGIIGVAPDAHLFALKVLDDTGFGWDYDIIAALEWVSDYNQANSEPIRITNNSYAGIEDVSYTETLRSAFKVLADSGVLHVAGAGNLGNVPGRGDNVDYPARFASVIAVAATDSRDRRASFSSTGPDLELSAPGVNIESTKLGGDTELKSGTSMACPHVTGVAALVMEKGLTDPELVRARLIGTADDLGDTGRDDKYGWGLVDADEAADLYSVDNPPTVSITNPSDGETINGNYTVIADATDDNGEVSVTLTIDGSITEVMNPGSGNSWTYDWDTTTAVDGNHSLVATATDSIYQITESATISVTVNNSTNNPPIANFSFETSGLTAIFTDLSSDDGTITAWNWNFGDSNTSTSQSPTHSYSVDGTYTVTLTVTDEDGATGSVSKDVIVSSGSSGAIILSAEAYKSTGSGYANLTWSGATTEYVDIYQNGIIIENVVNNTESQNTLDGLFLGKGGGSATLKVCETDNGNCSNDVYVSW